ncbi:MAG: PAS domain S-box protein [Candidatus Marinimicrobia bacterium]|jgi:PAS domain S-box-containing protein|nr:PAS domain S-box protein [Candidatus Neomarinimicrobiota bacterium]
MEKASEIIKDLMSQKAFRRKRDVAEFFGVSPQALSIWIAKGKIPPKHLLKLTKENTMMESSKNTPAPTRTHPEQDESKTVIDYLMRENVALKQENESLRAEVVQVKTSPNSGSLLDKIVADSLLICGRVSDGIITQADGRCEEILGYDADQLVGCRYDEEEWIHPDELSHLRKVQEKLKESQTMTEARYSAIQRWKHGKTGDYVMLSVNWDLSIDDDTAIVVCKPIDGFINERGVFN